MKIGTVVATAALLAGMLVAGPNAAQAEGRLTFTKGTVQSCTGMGKCIWKVTCQVGQGGKAQVVQEVRGTSRDVKEINRSFDVQRFPVNVTCALQLDDGWVSTAWKDIAKADLAVPGGGDYDFAMSTKEKGGVTVHLTVDSLEVGTAPAAGAPAPGSAGKIAKASSKSPARSGGASSQRQYLSVFQATPQGAAVLVGLPWEQFKARADQLDAQGSRIVALDTYLDGGRRLWSGIFRSGNDKQAFVTGLEWEAFSKKWKDMVNNQHMRLVDVVLYDEGPKRLLGGAFREGYDLNALWVGQEQKAFEGKVTELGGEKQRLTHMEVYRSSGNKLNYAGAFREGSGNYGLWTGLDRDAFLTKWKKASEGTQINEVKTYTEGKKRLYDAVIGSGGMRTEVDLGQDWAAFSAKWKEQVAKGMRVVDLETYQD